MESEGSGMVHFKYLGKNVQPRILELAKLVLQNKTKTMTIPIKTKQRFCYWQASSKRKIKGSTSGWKKSSADNSLNWKEGIKIKGNHKYVGNYKRHEGRIEEER